MQAPEPILFGMSGIHWKKSAQILFVVCICVILSACSLRSYKYTPELRAKSMKKFADKEFTFDVEFPEKGQEP